MFFYFAENVITPSSSLSGVSTLKSHASRNVRECQNNESPHENQNGGEFKKSNLINATGYYGSNIALTHCESLHTTISRESGSFGLLFADSQNGAVVIHSVTPGGPAERYVELIFKGTEKTAKTPLSKSIWRLSNER